MYLKSIILLFFVDILAELVFALRFSFDMFLRLGLRSSTQLLTTGADSLAVCVCTIR